MRLIIRKMKKVTHSLNHKEREKQREGKREKEREREEEEEEEREREWEGDWEKRYYTWQDVKYYLDNATAGVAPGGEKVN